MVVRRIRRTTKQPIKEGEESLHIHSCGHTHRRTGATEPGLASSLVIARFYGNGGNPAGQQLGLDGRSQS